MKIISDVEKEKSKIKESITKYGHLAQHHFELFLNYAIKGETPLFLDADNYRGALIYQKDQIWRLLSDPICPEDEKVAIITEALDFIFKKQKAKKVIMEDITKDVRKKIASIAKEKKLIVRKPSCKLFWPVVDLKNFSEDLPGKPWKWLRKARNTFFKENKVVFKNINEVSKQDLKDLMVRWKKNRKDNDQVHFVQYTNFIDNHFEGFDLVRIMEVNGNICSISGGWKIPNTKSYYSYFGIHDYSVRDLGEVAYLDEFIEAKKIGIETFDLGGMERQHLGFKLKFHPASFYETDTFTIIESDK